jgi:PadR family transcriptional regulator, regulatory protein PadR
MRRKMNNIKNRLRFNDQMTAEDRSNFTERLVRANKDLMILLILCKNPMCGIDLMKEIFSVSKVFLHQGSLYPVLHSLEEEGLVQAKYEKGNMKAKIYNITPEGREIIQKSSKTFVDSISLFNSISPADHLMTNFNEFNQTSEAIGEELEKE